MTGVTAAQAPAAPTAGALSALETPVRRVKVWPGCGHDLSRAEAVVIASPPFQRLRRLRQMGLAFHAWPNAENTRASHSLGVAYWAASYLNALDSAADPPTDAALRQVRDALGPRLSLSLVLRLFALLHDVDLLPLGHTLRYQSAAFAEPPGRPRLAACLAAIRRHARDEAFHDAPTPAARAAWLDSFEQHLHAAGDALAGRETPARHLLEELVNSGLGADLADFALRDSAAITRAQRFPDGLVGGLRLAPGAEGPGLALDAADPARAAAAVALADDLYRARFEVFAGSVFHPVKLAADAMLDFILRRLGDDPCRGLLPEARILEMGDDDLLDALARADAEAAARLGAPPLGAALLAGVLHAEIWRTEDLGAFAGRPDARQALSLDPAWRTLAEQRLHAQLPQLADGDLIVAVAAPTMQAKPANARLRAAGEVFTLAEAGDRGFRVQAAETAQAYGGLWSLRVYLSPRAAALAEPARAAACHLFGSAGP